ncbi:hypothetical protein X777_15783 [Ooceraea biroi]|uniref:THAP-type domain-containing protein n=1 Tax=Ooceraea biroi TaxID=2015173 RepID=A0A026WT12_OOCBI|nr:hypothetical protein X777_15783 [Ooceraea biroi]
MTHVSLYRFPRNDDLLREWQLAIGTEKDVNESSRICLRHFKEDDFTYTLAGEKRFLKRGVVPSLHLDEETGRNQLCNRQNATPKNENQSIDIADEHIVEAVGGELLNITESQVETRKDHPLSYIIGKRNEATELSSSPGHDEPRKKCKRYLYDVQWEEISTSPVQAKIYWEVVIGKIRRQKLTLRTLRQKVRRLKKKILELHVQIKDVTNTDSHSKSCKNYDVTLRDVTYQALHVENNS